MRVTTVRLDDTTISRVDHFAHVMERSRTWVVQQALDHYLNQEQWFVQQVEQAQKDVTAGKTVPHDEVMAEIHAKIAKRGSK